MRRSLILCLVILLILTACGPASGGSANSNNGPAWSGGFSAVSVKTTYIKSEGSDGRIAVMVASPKVKRFAEGAGIVVVVPSIFSPADSFMRDPDLASLGLVQVSFLWPGSKDSSTGAASEGSFDSGGPNSTMVLRDVIRFASGRLADINGRYVFGLATIPPLTDEVGLYAFGDAGMAVVKTLSLYGDQFQGLQYYVGRENPTLDSLAASEIGYYDAVHKPVVNPFYIFPAGYGFGSLELNYTNLAWDPQYVGGASPLAGRPYLDLDGNGQISGSDFVFDGFTPVVQGKRFYSIALTQALLDTGALTLSNWPADVATPQEAASFWGFLQSDNRFAVIQNEVLIRNLKVMLVFAQEDHAQVAPDKPHIHQAYQGFRFQARLWVRLNPDRAYVQYFLQVFGGEAEAAPAATAEIVPILDFPDNPANTQPNDWATINDYAYPARGPSARLIPLAAVAEMADRAHSGIWDENLGQVLYHYTAATPTP